MTDYEIPPEAEPLRLFGDWLEAARGCGLREPTAMSLATVDEAGCPDVRIVLLKQFDERGFVFYTNMASAKARQLESNPQAALCFHWDPLARQVRVRGKVTRVSDAEADAYFATRDRGSRIGAWASAQSQPLTGRTELDARIAEMERRFPDEAPRPPHWSGYRLLHEVIEFWQGRAHRLHDRVQYRMGPGGWERTLLYP